MDDTRQLYCCGGPEVILINIDAVRSNPLAREWSWQASDSPEILTEHRQWFAHMDECKPVLDGTAVLMCSSTPGGISVIRKSDKKCLFYSQGQNAHSAALIENRLLAAACSLGGDYLRLYELNCQRMPAEPVWEMHLKHGHGVVWDQLRSVLWAVGFDKLLKLKVKLNAPYKCDVLQQWVLPHPSAHDLTMRGASELFITHDKGVCVFEIDKGTLEPVPGMETTRHVKSFMCNPISGKRVFTQGLPLFTHRINIEGEDPLDLPSMLIYKVRWATMTSLNNQLAKSCNQ